MRTVLQHCEELGINVRIQTQDQINQYNKEHNGKMLFSLQRELPDPAGRKHRRSQGKPLKEAGRARADRHSLRGERLPMTSGEGASSIRFGSSAKSFSRMHGLLACVNGHIPETYMKMEDEGWGVDYYMTGLYLFGRTHAEWEKLYESNPDLAPAAGRSTSYRG